MEPLSSSGVRGMHYFTGLMAQRKRALVNQLADYAHRHARAMNCCLWEVNLPTVVPAEEDASQYLIQNGSNSALMSIHSGLWWDCYQKMESNDAILWYGRVFTPNTRPVVGEYRDVDIIASASKNEMYSTLLAKSVHSVFSDVSSHTSESLEIKVANELCYKGAFVSAPYVFHHDPDQRVNIQILNVDKALTLLGEWDCWPSLDIALGIMR